MISYKGNYAYNKLSVLTDGPESIGVYYCGTIGLDGLCPLYIGRAKGDGVSIRSRLLDHLSQKFWPDVTHFGYCICTTQQEAEALEIQEIKRFNPKYNIQWTTPFSR